MKKHFLLVFILGWVMGATQADAFNLEDSIELSYPRFSPYPYVLSQPIDILPGGFTTINVGDEIYYYCNGIFYQKVMLAQKYAVVPAPVGAVVFAIPPGYRLMFINGSYYHEDQGVYYERTLDGYKVVFPPV